MAFFNFDISGKVKELERALMDAGKRINNVLSGYNESEALVRTAYENVRRAEAYAAMEKMELEVLNRNKDGLRIGALREAGYQNLGQLIGMTQQQLDQINGIGTDSAAKIAKDVRDIYSSVYSESVVRLSYDKRNADMDNLVRLVHIHLHSSQAAKEAVEIRNAKTQELIAKANAFQEDTKQLKWLFYNKAKKAEIEQQLDGFISEVQGSYLPAVDRIEKQFQTASSLTTEEYWKEYHDNAAPYYTYLEQVSGTNQGYGVQTSSAKTAKRPAGMQMLPEELLQKIEALELDLEYMKADLRRYQMFGTKYIVSQKKSLLGDEMGLGKTMQAIAAIAHLKKAGKKRFIVVCPLSVLVNWVREIEKHTQFKAIGIHGNDRGDEFEQWNKSEDIAVTTYETLGRLDFASLGAIDMVIVDEAHYVKNPEAIRTQNVKRLVDLAEYALYMTGTPLENKVDEMKFLIESLQPEVAASIQGIDQLAQANQFKELIAPVYLRRVREDVLKELPELIEMEDWLIMNEAETRKYEEALMSDNFANVRKVSWNADDVKQSSKAQRLLEICTDAAEEQRKIIVFSFFKDTLQLAAKLFGERCVGVIHGGINSDERQKLVDKFTQAEPGAVLVSQIEAGGVGLNIQAASVVIFCEPQFKPSTENQAIARAYRMGQARSVLVHRLLMDDTADERIMEILRQKTEIFNSFADESVIGETDILKNESRAMQSIMEEERKRLGLERNTEDKTADAEVKEESVETQAVVTEVEEVCVETQEQNMEAVAENVVTQSEVCATIEK